MQEWRELISEARQQGITKEELLNWFESVKSRVSKK